VAVYLADLLDEEAEAGPLGSKPVRIGDSDLAALETLGVLSQLSELRELALESCG